MSREKRMVNIAADSMAPLPGSPLVEICGQNRLLIENHRGIAGYGHSEIMVNVCYGRIIVCGENLKLRNMSKEKLVITGSICAVRLQRRD